jgi:predicted CoA-substrate-specific enzyme activase
MLHVGLDIGSTTVKLVALPDIGAVPSASSPSLGVVPVPVFKKYAKHLSDVKAAVTAMLRQAEPVLRGSSVTIGVTGSGGINVARSLRVGFVQEVVACTEAVEVLARDADVAIELGGEDAKITYFESKGSGLEQRMNGTCAGGTGSFIDHMAVLLKTDGAGLDALAASHEIIYPIASRCGVFAKTDVQPLLNEGARREDIAASVLQAVVNQTIGGLACGKPIRGKVVFLGGPLHFLPQLRRRFVETLKLAPEDVIAPEDAHFFVAIGAALLAKQTERVQWEEFCSRIPGIMDMAREERHLPPMFHSAEEYAQFRQRHAAHAVPRAPMADARGPCFVGIDSGSTTTKVALIDADGRLLHSHYGPNMGNPLASTTEALLNMYARVPSAAFVAQSCVTGYGEGLVKAALHVDIGEIETLAHFKAADFFLPGVDFVLDIGGQDMKSLRIRNGAIDSIMLNEACSSGCGSFISTFATSLGMPVEEFARAGIESKSPTDLGTRCTVFMNSRVKQAQKEGASVPDISGGIAISVIKNALFKVIRLRSAEEMGQRIVVQGGTFYNDAVLRAFEKISGREAVRPDIAGIMGAFGAALIAREHYAELGGCGTPPRVSAMLAPAVMGSFSCKTSTRRCGKCPNNCLLTINEFSDGGQFVSGNRCERGAILSPPKPVRAPDVESCAGSSAVAHASSSPSTTSAVPNIYAWKLRRVFKYPPLPPTKAIRGDIGIPRVLNMYEDYPFWHTFFSNLGFRVILSVPTTKTTFEIGMETIPSDTVCYPAKLVHGHIEDLVRRGLRKIWLPCIPFNIRETEQQHNTFHCPIVGAYPEVARVNCDLRHGAVDFVSPFLPSLTAPTRLAHRLHEELSAKRLGEDAGAPPISLAEIEAAIVAATEAEETYR